MDGLEEAEATALVRVVGVVGVRRRVRQLAYRRTDQVVVTGDEDGLGGAAKRAAGLSEDHEFVIRQVVQVGNSSHQFPLVGYGPQGSAP